VRFPSLEDNTAGQQSTLLDGCLFRRLIIATDSAARADAMARVPAFPARFFGN
jgi:hypothetical protein